jgi:DNA-binding transcriptional MocR family regulator
MTLACRESLVRLARDFDALIISDDVYDFLWWETDRAATLARAPEASSGETLGVLKAVVPRLVDVDRVLDGGAEREGADGFGNVVSNGSFSKIVGPGVRTGWIEGELLFRFFIFIFLIKFFAMGVKAS